MHELSIALEIISIVEKEIDRRKLGRIDSIKLRVGALAGVDPEALSFGFEAASADTSLAGTTLDIDWVEVQGRCLNCGEEFAIDDYAFLCPRCDSPEVEITRGQELDIMHITERSTSLTDD
jgi:hydrogenase nickel incorporation protein HypA/HybF